MFLSAFVKIMFWLSWQNCFVEFCIWTRFSSIAFLASLLFKNLWNWWMVLRIEIWLLILWKTVLLSISLINLCMAIFLFLNELEGKTYHQIGTGWKHLGGCFIYYTVVDKLMNYLLLICSRRFFVLFINLLRSIVISSKFVCILWEESLFVFQKYLLLME